MKPNVVFLPGLLCDAALFAPQIDALADVCQPFVADLTRDDSIETMARRVLRHLPPGACSVVGLSMGGYVAQELVRQAPERVQRLALLDTRARVDEEEETRRRKILMKLAQTHAGFTPVTSRMLPLLIHPDRVNECALTEGIRSMAERVGVEAYLRQQAAVMARPDFRANLGAIACPTLLICGRQDVLTPLEFHHEMAAMIPHAHLEIIEDCGHLSTLERPAQVNTLLRRWLNEALS